MDSGCHGSWPALVYATEPRVEARSSQDRGGSTSAAMPWAVRSAVSELRATRGTVPGWLSTRISRAFDSATQSRGLTYARGGRVLGLVVHARTAEARVRGTRP